MWVIDMVTQVPVARSLRYMKVLNRVVSGAVIMCCSGRLELDISWLLCCLNISYAKTLQLQGLFCVSHNDNCNDLVVLCLIIL